MFGSHFNSQNTHSHFRNSHFTLPHCPLRYVHGRGQAGRHRQVVIDIMKLNVFRSVVLFIVTPQVSNHFHVGGQLVTDVRQAVDQLVTKTVVTSSPSWLAKISAVSRKLVHNVMYVAERSTLHCTQFSCGLRVDQKLLYPQIRSTPRILPTPDGGRVCKSGVLSICFTKRKSHNTYQK